MTTFTAKLLAALSFVQLAASLDRSEAAPLIRIAALYPATGQEADFRCITEAVVKDAGADRYSIAFFDNAQDALETKSIVEGVIRDGFDVVVGTRTSQEAIIASNLLDAAKIPFVSPIASHPDVTAGRIFALRIVGGAKHYADLLGSYAVNELKSKTIAIVTNQSNPYSTFYAKAFEDHIRKNAPTPEINKFDIINGYKDYEYLASEIEKTGADTLFISLYTEHALPLFYALVKAKSDITILSTGGINDGAELVSASREALSNMQVIFNGVWDRKLHGNKATKYLKLMGIYCKGHSNTLRTVLAFDAINSIIENNPRRLGMDKPNTLVKRIKENGIDGVSGSIRFAKDGETERPLELFLIDKSGVHYQGRVD